MTGKDRQAHGSLGDDNAPQFEAVPDEDLTPDQLHQVAEASNTKPADPDRPSPRPSDGRGTR